MGGFRDDVVAGLSATPKTLPSKYLYDERGSALFERITRLPEYYPTRVETALLAAIAPELAANVPAQSVLVEFGSGSSAKTDLLLSAAPHIAAYAPIDISPEALAQAVRRLSQAYPDLRLAPQVADFTQPVALSAGLDGLQRVGFFPGSTIGNFDRERAVEFLAYSRAMLGSDAHFIVGFDLVKAREILVAAYDDAEGVTSEFNLNLLQRINKELQGTFDISRFRHHAVWDADENRMEMHLASTCAQSTTAAEHVFDFADGETIHTENSYKYTPESFQDIAESAGWRLVKLWTSPPPAFGIALLRAVGGA